MVYINHSFPPIFSMWVYLALLSPLLKELCTRVAIQDFNKLCGINVPGVSKKCIQSRGGFRQVQKVCINLSNISDFLKQSIEINYQIHDYKNFRLSHVKLRKFLKKLKDSMLQVSLFPLHLSYIFAVPCDLYFLPPGWRTRLNSPHEPFCFCEFDFLEPLVD